MKNLLFLFLMLAMTIRLQAQIPTTLAVADIKSVQWLEGTWERTNAKPGRSGVEIWKWQHDEWVGRGIALRGTDTTFVEKLKIVKKDNELFYTSDVPENNGLVYFKFTEQGGTSFTCENPAHDFPKKISYDWKDGVLKATVSDGIKSMEYFFRKVE